MTVEPQPSSKPAHESAQEHKPAYEYFSDDPSFPTRRVIGVMFVGAFLGYLNETLLNVALTSFMQEFGVDKTTVQWMATGFLLVMGALAPLTASLVQWVPTRRLTLLTLATFLAGSLICAMAPSFWVLLAGRLVQALSGALTMPLLMNATLAIYPPNRRGKVMGMVAMVFSVAPALGPTLSGLIVDHLGWRWLFLLTMPLVLVSMGLVWRYLKVDIVDITRPRIDALSVLLSVAGFGGLVFIGSSFSDMPVAQAVLVAVASVLLILAFALRQFRLRTPLLNLRAFGYPQYAFAVIVLASNVFLFLGMELLLPMYAQQVLMLSATVTGLILLPGSIVQALLLPAFGTLLDRRGGRFVVLPGAVLMLVTLVVMWMSITPSAHVHTVLDGGGCHHDFRDRGSQWRAPRDESARRRHHVHADAHCGGARGGFLRGHHASGRGAVGARGNGDGRIRVYRDDGGCPRVHARWPAARLRSGAAVCAADGLGSVSLPA